MNIYDWLNATSLSDEYKKLDRLATEIEKVSGYSLEQLLELFMSGYTLKPPVSGYTAMYTIIDEMAGDAYE